MQGNVGSTQQRITVTVTVTIKDTVTITDSEE